MQLKIVSLVDHAYAYVTRPDKTDGTLSTCKIWPNFQFLKFNSSS